MEFRKYVPKVDTLIAARMIIGGLLTYQGSASAYEVYLASKSIRVIDQTIDQDVDKVTKAYQAEMPVLLPNPTTEEISRLATLQTRMEQERDAVRRNREELFKPNYALERKRRAEAFWQTPLLPIGLLIGLYRLRRKPDEKDTNTTPQTYTAKLWNKVTKKREPFKELQEPGTGSVPDAFKQAFESEKNDI